MMRAHAERVWRSFLQRFFDRDHGLARRNSGAIANAENMGVDGEGFCAKGGVHHHIGSFPAHAGQSLQRIAVGGHFAGMITDEDFRQSDDVLRLVIIQADGFNVGFQAL